MATSIPPVTGKTHIQHCMLIDLTLGSTTYYLSGAFKPITYDSNTYQELGSFLGVGEIAEDIKASYKVLSKRYDQKITDEFIATRKEKRKNK